MEVQKWVWTNDRVHEVSPRLGKPLHWSNTQPGKQLRRSGKRVWWCYKVLTSQKVEQENHQSHQFIPGKYGGL